MAAIVAHIGRAQGNAEIFHSMTFSPRAHSGRRFVLVAGVVTIVIWGTLYLVFREWRSQISGAGAVRSDSGCSDHRAPARRYASGY